MNKLVTEAGVPTPRYARFGSNREVQVGKQLRFPLFVKQESLYGSVGISDSSVALTAAEAELQVEKICSRFGSALAEEFIEGREFTLFLLDAGIDFAASEVRFRPNLDRLQRIITAECVVSPNRRPTAHAPVSDLVLAKALEDLARAAYAAVGANHFAKVDIRESAITGDLYVIEVDSSPRLGGDSETLRSIHAAGKSLKQALWLSLKGRTGRHSSSVLKARATPDSLHLRNTQFRGCIPLDS